MHKLLVIHHTPDDPAGARTYYRDTHMPLAARTPGLLSCRFSLSPVAPDGSTPFFCVYEATFASARAMADAFSTEPARAVVADAANFATAGSIVQHFDVGPLHPSGSALPDEAELHKVLVLHRMPADREASASYYRDRHMPLAARTPNQLACRYSLDPVGMDGSKDYFCVYEGFFASRDAMVQGLGTEIGQGVVKDSANFADRGSIVLNYRLEAYPIPG